MLFGYNKSIKWLVHWTLSIQNRAMILLLIWLCAVQAKQNQIIFSKRFHFVKMILLYHESSDCLLFSTNIHMKVIPILPFSTACFRWHITCICPSWYHTHYYTLNAKHIVIWNENRKQISPFVSQRHILCSIFELSNPKWNRIWWILFHVNYNSKQNDFSEYSRIVCVMRVMCWFFFVWICDQYWLTNSSMVALHSSILYVLFRVGQSI